MIKPCNKNLHLTNKCGTTAQLYFDLNANIIFIIMLILYSLVTSYIPSIAQLQPKYMSH